MRTILHEPLRHSLADCLRELKYGRPAAAQKFLDKCAEQSEWIGISPSRKWAMKKVAEGKCARCGKPSLKQKTLCPDCAVKQAHEAGKRNLAKQLKKMREENI